jgi:CRP/FNR family transcriptional regulator, cyclic AMP receptor protein
MAMALRAAENTSLTHPFDEPASVPAHTRVPYGLPIVDNCSTCKLRQSNYFCSFSGPVTKAFEPIKHTSSYPKGAVIFTEGQAARGVYILCQGRAKVSITSAEGRTLILRIAEPGDILGLHSCVTGNPHEVTIETLQPAQLAFVARADMLSFMSNYGEACLRAAEHLSRSCQSAFEVLRSIGLSYSVPQKLARLLLHWAAAGSAGSNGLVRVHQSLTHEEIAELIGSTRETVTRTLGEFRRKHAIEINGASLLLNTRALTNLAGA